MTDQRSGHEVEPARGPPLPAERRAARTRTEIVGQITGGAPHVGEVLYQPELVVRGSTARVPSP